MTVTNGSGAAQQRVLKAGVWAPSPAFFDANEELDVPTFRKHIVSLAKVGMQPVVNGSMGEAFHLSAEERVTLVREARSALDEAGHSDVVIIAGTGGNSTRQTIEHSKAAAQAGADIAIVIPPGYYSGAMSTAALKQFFLDVAEGSPLPVMIYNYPGAAGGIDMDSDLVIDIARSHPNICGVKLTCGAVGKLTRIGAGTATESFAKYPRKGASAPDFITLGGFADFLLPTIAGGRAHGAIMGLANVYPAAIAKLFALSHKIATDAQPSRADIDAALKLQDLCAGADAAFARTGIAGTKWWLAKHNGYPKGVVRRPLLEFSDEAGAKLEADPIVAEFYEIEQSLAKAA